MTESSAYEESMKSHEEEKKNRDFERFTGFNLLGTDFLDSFILIDDKLSGNSMMLNRMAPDVKKYLRTM